MSGSKGAQPLTPQKKEILQSLLARAGIHHEEAEPSTPSDFFLVDLQSMSDAPKRQSDDYLGDEQAPKRMFAIHVPYVAEGPPQPFLVGKTPRGKPIYLPQDVPNVTTWGRSIIQIGKFMAKRGEPNLTYAELFEDRTNIEKCSYVKWAIAQTDSAKGLLLDLASYLRVRSDEEAEGEQLPFIPGTSTLRVFK